ncbi:hypothetical protein BDV39DRAFT_181707 [Aspergillus sergii]|uniref:Uncharacterized protein n=1 Tax=Aspergillus sergii TaxID=1034303 RepID=A0A5N6WWH8_9EURO|nr:hypothetical protein BDV39DRAFT_181707 [Aspergillus sergii]
MSQKLSDTLVDKNHQKGKNNLPQQQTLFYPCVYTTQYQRSPASGTLIDEKSKNLDTDFITLGEDLRRERKMKVVKRYIQHSSDDKERLKLLLRFAIASKLCNRQHLLKRETGSSFECQDSAGPSLGFPGSCDAEKLVMCEDPNYGSRVDA